MRFLIVTEAWEPQVSGVVGTYRNLRRELQAMGHEVHILSPHDFKFNFPCPTYPDIRLALPLPGAAGRKIAEIDPDRIHIATEGPLGMAAARYCDNRGLPFTTAYHTHFADYIAARVPFAKDFVHGLAEKMIRNFHNRSAGVMTVSPKMDDYLHKIGVTAPMVRLERGVDFDIFHPGPSAFMKEAGPVALYVGRIAKEKNIEGFLDLRIPHKKVVVGDGPQRAELQARYPEAVFTGVLEGSALADCYRRAAVFVFPSKTDTFGNVLIEAMACGTPVAAFSGDGGHTVILREAFTGATGVDLQSAFQRAVNVPGTAEQRFEYVRENYNWRPVARQFIEARPVEGIRTTSLSLSRAPQPQGRPVHP